MFSRRQISVSTCSPVTKTDFGFAVAIGWLCALTLLMSLGCCSSKPNRRLIPQKNSSSELACSSPTTGPFATVRLPQIEFSRRTAIELPVTMENVMGWPLNQQLAPSEKQLQELSVSRCQEIAFAASPAGNEIDKHRDWLLRNDAGSQVIFEAMSQQAIHERNSHVGRTLDLFFNLANIYSQQPTLQDSHQILDGTTQAIEKLRAASIPLAMDVAEIDRMKLEIDEQTNILLKQQQQLTAGLQLLLQLDSEPLPIWTTLPPQKLVSEDFGTDPAGEYATALIQRGDLRAIELLANDPGSVTTEQLTLLATGGTSLLNAKLPVPKVAQWWQFRIRNKIKQQLEVLSQQETIRRREQLMDLAESKRQQIRKEIFDATETLNSNRKLLTIKQQRLASLLQSILAAERAKDEVLLDAEKHVVNLLKANKLESEIINQLFAIAIDINQLKQARGDYANESIDPNTCR
jgi:hypothetical protein